MRRNLTIWLLLCPILLLSVLATGCVEDTGAVIMLTEVPGGDPAEGREAISAYGCGTCHTVPGVAGANGHVGPPLTQFARRHYIAGNVANTPENLISWIMAPEAVEPGTAMPNLGVTPEDARAIAAYLSTLR